MSQNPFEKYNIDNPPFDDWIMYPSDIVREEHVLDALGLSKEKIPRYRVAVLYKNYTDYISGDLGEVIRIEARVGDRSGIADEYRTDVEPLLNNEYYKFDRNGEDTTYINFYFDVPPILKPILEEL